MHTTPNITPNTNDVHRYPASFPLAAQRVTLEREINWKTVRPLSGLFGEKNEMARDLCVQAQANTCTLALGRKAQTPCLKTGCICSRVRERETALGAAELTRTDFASLAREAPVGCLSNRPRRACTPSQAHQPNIQAPFHRHQTPPLSRRAAHRPSPPRRPPRPAQRIEAGRGCMGTWVR